MFLLDTDHVTILQEGPSQRYERFVEHMSEFTKEDFFLSVVSFHEQVLGANAYINRAPSQIHVMRGYRLLIQILDYYAGMQVLRFEDDAASHFSALRKRKIRIGTMDLRIAATALAQDLVVLTSNDQDFGQVPDLRHEDWIS